MIAKLRSSLTSANLVSVLAALVLVASPWVAGFAQHEVAAGNAWGCGLLLLSFALAAILQVRDWRSWMILVPGLWAMLSPWLLDFAPHTEATLVHVTIGSIVSILGTIELCRTETLCLDD